MADKFERLGLAIGEVYRSWKAKLNERLRPLGLSQAKWFTLLHLSRFPEGIIQKDLANRIGVEGPTLVRLLDRLERDGWVLRKNSKTDRRSKIIYLTRKAQPTLGEIHKIVTVLREEILSEIPDGELKTTLGVMLKIKGKIDSL
ncbi:MAG: MarR family transcriptional regulator [Nitrospinae bacterium]|nr:MarR family transcriptional regulator [Nitrospinota bacterium]